MKNFKDNSNKQRLYVSLFYSSSEAFVKEVKNIANEKEFCENYKYIIHIGRFLSEEYKILSISKLNFNNKEIILIYIYREAELLVKLIRNESTETQQYNYNNYM